MAQNAAMNSYFHHNLILGGDVWMDENLKQFSWSLAVAVSASFGIHLVKSKTFELRSVEGRCLQFLEGRKGQCNN